MEVHYEIHLLLLAIFRDNQCVGGVAAFVSRAQRGADYKAHLRGYLAGRQEASLALWIHDDFFNSNSEGISYAVYLAEVGSLGGKASVDALREKLGDLYKTYKTKIGKKAAAALRKKFATEEAYRAHMSEIAELGRESQRKKFGSHEAYAEALREQGRVGMEQYRSRIGEDAFREKTQKLQAKGAAARRLDTPDLSCNYVAGASDETDWKAFKSFANKIWKWKTSRGVTDDDENIQALNDAREGYREGYVRHEGILRERKNKKK